MLLKGESHNELIVLAKSSMDADDLAHATLVERRLLDQSLLLDGLS